VFSDVGDELKTTLAAIVATSMRQSGTATRPCQEPAAQVQALSDVPWGQLQVIPYYARVAASLNAVFPEIAPGETESSSCG
jgi:hypothetical protein